MEKIYRVKTSSGGLSIALTQILAIRYQTNFASSEEPLTVEIILPTQILDTQLSPAELEALQKAWNEAL